MKHTLYHLLKRYRFFLVLLAVGIALLLFSTGTGIQAAQITWSNLLEMLSVLPPIFILLGLLDVWVPRETIVKHMGEGSGVTGVLLSFFLGSAAAGPLYAAFPVAAVLLKKGCRLFNAFILIGAWSTAKIPQLLFEVAALGPAFTFLHLGLSLPGIALIALVTEKTLRKEDRAHIYETAAKR